MRYLKLAILFCIQALFNGLPPAYGQASPFLFHHLGTLNENSINFVSDILFDSKKQVWLAAQSGFYRYDGQHYIPYRKTKDSSSIPDNFVHALCEDRQGNIWGGTEAGIFRFNPSTQQFKQYLTPDAYSDQGVNNICIDANGRLWATTPSQLLQYNVRNDSFELRIDMLSFPPGNALNRIKKRGMLISEDGQKLWLATRFGLWAYDIANGRVLNAATAPRDTLFAEANTAALAKSAGGLLLYFDNTKKTIVQFDPVRMIVTKKISLAQTVPEAIGATLFEDRDGSIWFCSFSNQVILVDQKQNNRIEDLNAKQHEPFGLISNFFWQARQDDDGSIWLATPEGLFVCNEPKNLFSIHRLPSRIKELTPQVFIDVMAENPADQTWWMTTSPIKGIQESTTNKNGKQNQKIVAESVVIHYDPKSGVYSVIDLSKAPANNQGLKPDANSLICFYENDPVFITNNGAWVWKRNQNTWQTLEVATGISFPFLVKALARSADGGYFVAGLQQLVHFDPARKTLRTISLSGTANIANHDLHLYPRQLGKPTMYGSFGMSRIMQLRADSSFVIPLVRNKRIANTGYIDDMDVDSRGRVWISLKNVGLFMYNPANSKISQWDETDGLAINGIHNLTIDHKDNVWTIHRRQFSILLAGTNRFFQVAMPIANPNINWSNNLLTRQNGNIVANNFNDIVEFFPDRLLQKPVSRLPEISSINVNEKPRIFAPGKTIHLTSNENSLHFKFGMLTNKIFFPYELQYRLQGAEANWQTAGIGSEAFYNKLPPGKYTFKVRAVATNDSWASGEQSIELVIEKPIYQRFWFVLLLSMLIIGLLLIVSRYRLRKQRQVFELETKTAVLEREKATIQYDSLKQQLNPHFLFNSLTSLAGLIEADQQIAGDFLQRMSDMYRYILKSGDQETVPLSDELRFVQLYIDIQQTRFASGLAMRINVPEAYLNFRIAPVTLQNLIENAIKHNVVDEAFPLVIDIGIADDYLVVSNNLQKKGVVETSNKKGLEQFAGLYAFLSEKPVLIEETADAFIIKIPLI